MLKNIIFDIGDTLVDVSSWKNNLPEVLSDYLFHKYNIDNKNFNLAFNSAMSEVNKEEKMNPHVDKINTVGHSLVEKLGLDYESELDIKGFVKNFRNRNWHLLDNSKELLSRLSKEYTLYAVTNARVETINEIMDVFSIRKYFKSIVISEDSRATKNDGGLFRVFLERTGVMPKECVMVGNDLIRDGRSMQFGIPFCLVGINNDFVKGNYTFKIMKLEELDNILKFFKKDIERNCYFCKESIRNSLVCERCKDKLIKKIISEPESIKIVEELAYFTNLTRDEVLEKLFIGPILVRNDWIDKWPTTEEEINKFYSENLNYLFDLTIANMQDEWILQNNMITEYAQLRGYTDILDFGCGTAQASLSLLETGKRVMCVDASDFILKYVKFRFASRGLNANVSKYMEDRQYDFVICTDVLEHLINPINTLSILLSHLKKNGSFAFTARFFDKEDYLHPMHLATNSLCDFAVREELSKYGFKKNASAVYPRGLEIWSRNGE